MGVEIKWYGHASFRLSSGYTVVYIDPWKLEEELKDGRLVLVSHSHYDHYSEDDVAKVLADDGRLYSSNDVIGRADSGTALVPGDSFECCGVKVEAVCAYNPAKKFHPKENNWLGFIINIDGKRVYYSGDTDVIEEMGELGEIDVALLPVGGTYTMDAVEASKAVGVIKPKIAIPYHWGDIVGDKTDAQRFAEQAGCEVVILGINECYTV